MLSAGTSYVPARTRAAERDNPGRRGAADELQEDRPLAGRRVAEDRVQGGHRRRVQRADEVQDGRPVLPAPDAVLVLHGDDVGAPGEVAGRPDVVAGLVAPDTVVDFGGVREEGAGGLARDDPRSPVALERACVKVAMPQCRGG